MSCGAAPMYRAVQKSDAFISNHPLCYRVRRDASAGGQAGPSPEGPGDRRQASIPRLVNPWSVFQPAPDKQRERLGTFTAHSSYRLRSRPLPPRSRIAVARLGTVSERGRNAPKAVYREPASIQPNDSCCHMDRGWDPQL